MTWQWLPRPHAWTAIHSVHDLFIVLHPSPGVATRMHSPGLWGCNCIASWSMTQRQMHEPESDGLSDSTDAKRSHYNQIRTAALASLALLLLGLLIYSLNGFTSSLQTAPPPKKWSFQNRRLNWNNKKNVYIPTKDIAVPLNHPVATVPYRPIQSRLAFRLLVSAHQSQKRSSDVIEFMENEINLMQKKKNLCMILSQAFWGALTKRPYDLPVLQSQTLL